MESLRHTDASQATSHQLFSRYESTKPLIHLTTEGELGMAHTRSGSMVIGMVVALFGAAGGQESPDQLTRAEYTCRATVARQSVEYGDAVASCIAECKSNRSRVCDDLYPDPQTAACLDVARSRAASHILRQCGGFACPDCYGQACDTFAAGRFAQMQSYTTQIVDQVYCNDAFSPDGLSRAEAKCQKGSVQAGQRLGVALGRCLDRCERDARTGRADHASCQPARLDTPGFDRRTQGCVDRARARFGSGCESKCADRPECDYLGCSAIGAFIEGGTLDVSGDAYCVDEPPPVCGDGRITSGETCDPSAAASGCPNGEQCFACSFCLPPFCGDGMINGSEICDDFASPNGCPSGQVCSGCNCFDAPVCGDGQVTGGEACDGSAPESGCSTGATCVGCQFCSTPCGNGVIDDGEFCDPLAAPNGCGSDTLCTADCSACGSCHDPCEQGGALQASCSACVAEVCGQDDFCCRVAWDSICRNEAIQGCGVTCDGSVAGAFVAPSTSR